MAGTSRKARDTGSANAITADLVAVLVAVTDGEPEDHDHRQWRRAAERSVRIYAPLAANGIASVGRARRPGIRSAMSSSSIRLPIADGPAMPSRRTSISISYLGLTREDQVGQGLEAHWSGWYEYFPWEDQRADLPASLAKMLAPRLRAWSKAASTAALQRERWQRAAITFGLDEREWNEELVLQRYELLYEAGLVPEAVRTVRMPRQSFPAGR